MKIVFINSHPISYFSDLYKFLTNNNINIEAWYCSKYGVRKHYDVEFDSYRKTDGLLEGFKYKFLLNVFRANSAKEKLLDTLNPFILFKLIRLNKNDIIICHGWSRLTMLLVLFFGKLLGKRVGLRCETPIIHEYNYFGIKKRLRAFILTNLFKRVDYFFYIGTYNKEFYKSMGVPEKKLIFMPYSTKPSSTFRKNISRKNKILFCGKLINKKRPQDLIEAFGMLNNKNCELIFAGSGELESSLKKRSEELGISTQVLFKGLLNKEKLNELYQSVDVIVLPSGYGETWGLVISEAIEFGLPIIVSDLVGCSIDLCKNNGYIYKYSSITDLKDKLQKIYSIGEDEYHSMVSKSYEIKKLFSFKTINDNLISFINNSEIQFKINR